MPDGNSAGLDRILETDRLSLRQAVAHDHEFIFRLLNEPSWLRFIGDRNITTPEDARHYISEVLVPTYARFGFGLYIVEIKQTNTPIGLCGLIKRDNLKDVDIGFAFLRQYWHCGYALESARAVIRHASQTFALKRIVAITSPENTSSTKLLNRLGFVYERMVNFEKTDLKLYVKSL